MVLNILEVKNLTEKRVANIAISIPSIPNIFPLLEDSGEESPLKARIKRIPEIT